MKRREIRKPFVLVSPTGNCNVGCNIKHRITCGMCDFTIYPMNKGYKECVQRRGYAAHFKTSSET